MKHSLILMGAAMLAGLVLFAGGVWLLKATGGVNIHGYIALGLGVMVTAALGGGLMALAFHSSSHGFDDDDREP